MGGIWVILLAFWLIAWGVTKLIPSLKEERTVQILMSVGAFIVAGFILYGMRG